MKYPCSLNFAENMIRNRSMRINKVSSFLYLQEEERKFVPVLNQCLLFWCWLWRTRSKWWSTCRPSYDLIPLLRQAQAENRGLSRLYFMLYKFQEQNNICKRFFTFLEPVIFTRWTKIFTYNNEHKSQVSILPHKYLAYCKQPNVTHSSSSS